MKWSKSGDLLAIASDEKAVNLLDFKTGKIIYTGASHVKGNISAFHSINLVRLIREHLFRVLRLGIRK